MNGKPWSAAEDAVLREHFARVLPRGRRGPSMMSRLPGRSWNAITARAAGLGLQSPQHTWTPREIAILTNEWGDTSVRTLAHRLRRTRRSIAHKAVELGLSTGPNGIPQGRWSVYEAARRCGYANETMARILRWAGVRMERAGASPKGSYSPRYHVDQEEAMAAAIAWASYNNGTETLREAAQRVGLHYRKLAVVLRDAGRQAGRGNKPRYRPEEIDSLVAEHRANVAATKRAA